MKYIKIRLQIWLASFLKASLGMKIMLRKLVFSEFNKRHVLPIQEIAQNTN